MTARARDTPRDTLYFDGQCGMCRRSARVLRALDWLGRLDFADMTREPPGSLPVSFEQAMRGIPLRAGDGGVLIGFPAVRRALLQTPLGALPALVLYLPGVSLIGRRVYDLIARTRRRDACATEPASPRAL